MIANMKKDSPFGNILEYMDAEEKMMRITATGVPSGVGGTIMCCDSKETAQPTEYTDPNKSSKTIKQINYWIEESHKLVAELEWLGEGTRMTQTRTLVDDDTLHLENTMTKKDGSTCSFQSTFKRK